MATYAIGDIQGCFVELLELLDYLGFSVASDRLWFVGDLVNRGAQSLDVLRFVKNLGDRAVTVLGNHDLHLVMQAEGYGKASKEDTLDAVLAAPDRDDLLAWLRRQPLFHVEGEYAMVHAGLVPQWDVAQAMTLSDEVGEALNAANHPYFPNPNMTVTAAQSVKDTGFGQISASTMNNYARRLQMSLRFLF